MFGGLIATVAITTYSSEATAAPNESAAIINFSRTIGGFCVTYFQIEWSARNGPAVSFGIQGAICAAIFILVIPVLQIFGRKFRMRFHVLPPSE